MVSFRANLFQLMGGTIAASALTLVMLPILTRIFSPEQFGFLQLFQVVLSLPLVAVSLRYEIALLETNDDIIFSRLLIICYAVMLLVTLFALLACVLVYAGIFSVETRLLSVYWWLPAGLFSAGLLQISSYVALRYKVFPLIGWVKVVQVIVFSLVAVFLGLGVATFAAGLIVAETVGKFIAAATMLAKSRSACIALRKYPVRLRSLLDVALQFRKMPLQALPSALLGAASAAITPIAIFSCFGAAAAGQFALLERCINVPIALVAGVVAQAFTAHFADDLRNGDAAIHAKFRRLVAQLLKLAVCPCILLVAFAPVLFRQIFGVIWEPAGQMVQVLGPAFLASFVTFPINMALLLLGTPSTQLRWELFRFVCLGALWIIAKWMEVSLVIAVFWYGLVLCLCAIVFLKLVDNALIKRKRLLLDGS